MKAIADSLDRWCYLLRQGEELDTDDLAANLVNPAIQKALDVLAMMVQTPQERALYEARLDAKRERSTDLKLARREGREEGKCEQLIEIIELVLDSKYGPAGLSMLDRVKAVTELAKRRTMFRQLNAAASLDELRQLWS